MTLDDHVVVDRPERTDRNEGNCNSRLPVAGCSYVLTVAYLCAETRNRQQGTITATGSLEFVIVCLMATTVSLLRYLPELSNQQLNNNCGRRHRAAVNGAQRRPEIPRGTADSREAPSRRQVRFDNRRATTAEARGLRRDARCQIDSLSGTRRDPGDRRAR
jgi:hypothetical protein